MIVDRALRLAKVASLLAFSLTLGAPASADPLPVTLYDDPQKQVDPWKYVVTTQSMVARDNEKVGSIAAYEPAQRLLDLPELAPKLRAVGRFEIRRKDTATGALWADFCTAWLVDRAIAITNHHCVVDTPNNKLLQGRVRFGTFGPDTPGQVFLVDKIIEDNATYDFALLHLTGAPGDKFGVIKLDIREALADEPLAVVGHPAAHPLMIQRANCYGWHPAAVGDDLQHHCDTLGGSSGSLIFAQKDGRIVGLHYAAPDYVVSYNLAKQLTVLVQNSPILERLYRASITAQTKAESMSAKADPVASAAAETRLNADPERLLQNGLAAEARKDYVAAEETLKAADAAGNRLAAGYLARVYALQRKYAKARTWYGKAAQSDDPRGYAGLGYLLDYGLGGASDPQAAVPLYQKAAAKDFAPSLYYLGRLHEPGSGRPSTDAAPRNMGRAIALFDRAGALGYPLANYELGRIYDLGLGATAKDPARARIYFSRAAAAGNDDARRWLAARPDRIGSPE